MGLYKTALLTGYVLAGVTGLVATFDLFRTVNIPEFLLDYQKGNTQFSIYGKDQRFD